MLPEHCLTGKLCLSFNVNVSEIVVNIFEGKNFNLKTFYWNLFRKCRYQRIVIVCRGPMVPRYLTISTRFKICRPDFSQLFMICKYLIYCCFIPIYKQTIFGVSNLFTSDRWRGFATSVLIVGTHGIAIRYTSFDERSVADRNPVGSDDASVL